MTSQDVQLTVAVGAPDDVAPVGPLHRGSLPPQLAQPSQVLVTASASADYLLSLVVLDPALGGDYLTTWASDVVVTVTAGQSSATRILAVGDMVRLADADSASAILIRADKGDETLGVPATGIRSRPTPAAKTRAHDVLGRGTHDQQRAAGHEAHPDLGASGDREAAGHPGDQEDHGVPAGRADPAHSRRRAVARAVGAVQGRPHLGAARPQRADVLSAHVERAAADPPRSRRLSARRSRKVPCRPRW